jgi:uncharacterized SAM-binding protein YcdF (DUF218 family)
MDRLIWVVSGVLAILTFPLKYFFAKSFFRFTGQTDLRTTLDRLEEDLFWNKGVQAVVVLGRGIPGGKMTPAQEANIKVGMTVHHQLRSAAVLCLTGGYTENGSKPGTTTEADQMQKYAKKRGINGNTLIDREAIDTEASLRWLRTLAQEHGWNRIILVADLIHVPRIKWFLLPRHGFEETVEIVSSVWDVRASWTRAIHDLIWEVLAMISLYFPESLRRRLRGF